MSLAPYITTLLYSAPFAHNTANLITSNRRMLIMTADLFELHCVRLVIQCFYFFGSPTSARDVGILQVYALACDLISLAVTMDQQTRFPEYCAQSHARCISLAAFCILRISRSHLLPQINSLTGEDLFFKAADMSKKRSRSNSDLEFRTANILSQLWSSSKCFKFKDGTIDGLRLLLRGRLVSISLYTGTISHLTII